MKAKEGQFIQFSRRGKKIIGKVKVVREKSVIAYISDEDAAFFDYPTPLTVVKHTNYKIL